MNEHENRRKNSKRHRSAHLIFVLTCIKKNKINSALGDKGSIYFVEMSPAGKHSKVKKSMKKMLKWQHNIIPL